MTCQNCADIDSRRQPSPIGPFPDTGGSLCHAEKQARTGYPIRNCRNEIWPATVLGRKMDIDIFQLPGILKRRRHYIVLAVLVCLALSIIYVLRLTPLYTSSTELLLDPLGLQADGGNPGSTGAAAPQDQSSIDSQIYVIQSRATMEEVVRKLDLTKDPFLAPAAKKAASSRVQLTATATALKKHITVERAGQSLVFTIKAEHPDASKAADIANSVASVYLRQIDEARSEAARRASNSFQVQASELRDRVLKAELAVEKFKADNGLVSTGEKGLVIDQQLAGINQQLIDARVTEEQQQTIYEQAKKLTMGAIEAGAIPEVLQSTSIGLLRDRYVALLDRRSQLATSLGSNHPQLQAINSQVATMQNAIEQELDRIRQSMQSSYQRAVSNTKALTERLAKLTETSFDSSAAQIKMRQLESEADAVRTLYKAFLSRAEELGQQQSLSTNNSRVITAAVATPKSSAALKLLILAAASLFGMVVGSALAVLRELTTHPPLSEQSLIRKTGIATLARIRSEKGPAQNAVLRLFPFLRTPPRNLPTPMGEDHPAIQAIARQLLERLGDHLPATVLFISPGQNPLANGIVADTVQALIDLGQNVLYAPGDLAEKKPRQASPLGRPSLRSALNRERELKAPLADSLKYEHLSDFGRAPAGKVGGTSSGHPARTDGSSAEITIINACATRAADFLPSLLPHADSIVMVIKIGETTSEDLDTLLDTIGTKKEAILGTVVVED